MNKVCNTCGVEKPSECFAEKRRVCKECRSKYRSGRRKSEQETNPILYKCKQMAWNAHSRVNAPCREGNPVYKDLVNPFGFDSPLQMAEFLYNNFYDSVLALLEKGLTPSVDRIDPSIGYTPTNIRVIDFDENTAIGVENTKSPVIVTFPNGDTMEFDSVSSCSRYFNTYESHVRGWIQGKWKPRNKCKFEYSIS